MVFLQSKNSNLYILWKAYEWKILLQFIAIRNTLQPFGICTFCPFGIFCGHLLYFFAYRHVLPKKSGNPGSKSSATYDMCISAAWRSGNASVSRTEGHRFEVRQGLRFMAKKAIPHYVLIV
jgi:hypothetical protein